MKSRTILLSACFLCFAVVFSTIADAQITGAQRRDLRDIGSTLGQVAAALRKDDKATAEAKLAEAEEAFKKLQKETGLDESATVFKSVTNLFESRRADLGMGGDPAMAADGKQPVNSGAVDPKAADNVSFVRDVVPILTGKCVRCHAGNRARGGLDLSTFTAMKAGGDSGPLLVRGQPKNSLLIERVLIDDPDLRMPAGGQLFDDEIAVLVKWVTDGAAFDGNNEDSRLRDLARAKMAPKDLVIPKPKGTETVSFKNEVGPMFNRLCLDCHQGNNPAGGLSLVTFNDLMMGGDSGPVIIPGDAENSRLFRLVGGLELPRMPADNQRRIRRSEYAALKTWFEEGNTFDGPDPAAPILDYIDTPEKMAARERDARSADEWAAARKESTAALWKRGMPLLTPKYAEAGPIFAAGNVDGLDGIIATAAEQWKSLEGLFGDPDPKEKGLSILVVDSTYAHAEIARTLASTETDAPFHAFVTGDQETRYMAVDLSGASETTLSVDERVKIATTAAFLASLGPNVPRWLREGGARALNVRADRLETPTKWRATARPALGRVNPVDVLKDSSYEPEQTGAAGYVIADALIDAGGRDRFVNFIQRLSKGATVDDAARQAFGRSASDICALAKANL